MEKAQQRTLASLVADLDDMWTKFDQVYGRFSPAQWSRKFGKDWVFADQPYHLASFDRLAAQCISKGLASLLRSGSSCAP